MAAIVTSALFVPVAGLLFVLSFAAFGIPLRGFVTFGGALAPFVGVLAWWALMFLPALAYAAFVMPWSDRP